MINGKQGQLSRLVWALIEDRTDLDKGGLSRERSLKGGHRLGHRGKDRDVPGLSLAVSRIGLERARGGGMLASQYVGRSAQSSCRPTLVSFLRPIKVWARSLTVEDKHRLGGCQP